jgi:transcriptional regulator with XRE-family HTH domain
VFKRKNAIGEALRELRESRRFTGKEIAKLLGSTQGHVSKIENGRLRPSTEYIQKFCDVLGLSAGIRANLIAKASAFLISFNRWGAGQDSLEDLQNVVLQTQKNSKLIEIFGINILPGFIQADGYAKKIFESASRATTQARSARELKKALQLRLKQRELLKKGTRSYSVVISEAVLADCPFGRDVHLEQLKLLLTLARRKNLDLRVLPFAAERPVLVMNTFLIFDRNFIEVETQTMATHLWEKEEISVYTALFDSLMKVSLSGAESKKMIQYYIGQLGGK